MLREIGPRSGPYGAADRTRRPLNHSATGGPGTEEIMTLAIGSRSKRPNVVEDLAAYGQTESDQAREARPEIFELAEGAARQPSWPSRSEIARSRSSRVIEIDVESHQHSRNLVSEFRRVAGAYVDGHEGDEVVRQCLAPLVE